MNALLEEIFSQPDLHEYRRRINERWQEEQRRRAEFVEWLDEDKRAEWINGEVVVHSPERWGHGLSIDFTNDLLKAYLRPRRLGKTSTNKLVRFPRNDYIPDLCFWRAEVAETFTDDQTIFPPPALIVEVLSESTAEIDRGVKFKDYAAGGVQEYWIIDPESRSVERYERVEDDFDGHYELRQQAGLEEGGVLEPFVLPDLHLPVRALFNEQENLRAAGRLEQD